MTPHGNDKRRPDRNVNGRDPERECITCTGINYFSGEMYKSGRQPICLGFKSRKGQIPMDRMKQLEDLPAIKPASSVFLFGRTQASGRMYALGHSPLLMFGLEFRFKNTKIQHTEDAKATAKAGQSEQSSNQSSEVQPSSINESRSITEEALGAHRKRMSERIAHNWKQLKKQEEEEKQQRQPQYQQSQQQRIENQKRTHSTGETGHDDNTTTSIMQKTLVFLQQLQRSSQRQASAMSTMYLRASDRFPERLMKSTHRLRMAMGTTAAELCQHTQKTIIGVKAPKDEQQ